MKLLWEKYKKSSIYTYFCGIRIWKRRAFKKSVCSVGRKNTTFHREKEILIVKADAIGDYILMRNFWNEIKTSAAYKNAKITLVLSSAVKGLADYLDGTLAEKIIFIPHLLHRRLYLTQNRILKALLKDCMNTYYDEVWFPSQNVYNFRYLHNFIIHNIPAGEFIGTNGDLWLEGYNDFFLNYTKVMAVSRVDFEFNLNKRFFENVLCKKINMQRPFIQLPEVKAETAYAVLSIGAQDDYRCWHVGNYAKLISLLKKRLWAAVFSHWLWKRKKFDGKSCPFIW